MLLARVGLIFMGFTFPGDCREAHQLWCLWGFSRQQVGEQMLFLSVWKAMSEHLVKDCFLWGGKRILPVFSLEEIHGLGETWKIRFLGLPQCMSKNETDFYQIKTPLISAGINEEPQPPNVNFLRVGFMYKLKLFWYLTWQLLNKYHVYLCLENNNMKCVWEGIKNNPGISVKCVGELMKT